MQLSQKVTARLRRKKAIRKKIHGTKFHPRISVFRSAKHIYAQIINDDVAESLVAASTLTPELRSDLKMTGNIEAAKQEVAHGF